MKTNDLMQKELLDLTKEELIEIIKELLDDLDNEHMDCQLRYWNDICAKYGMDGRFLPD